MIAPLAALRKCSGYSVFERSISWRLARGWIPVCVKKTRQKRK